MTTTNAFKHQTLHDVLWIQTVCIVERCPEVYRETFHEALQWQKAAGSALDYYFQTHFQFKLSSILQLRFPFYLQTPLWYEVWTGLLQHIQILTAHTKLHKILYYKGKKIVHSQDF